MRYSHEELAAALSTPAKRVFPPTPQQARVVESAVDAPALVVAGAGSGKTETMSFRVVHLVANGLVERPDQVLGLTFTRKAALELAQRVAERLDRLRQAGILARDTELEPPTVATYNAWAGSIYREHALAIGRDPDAEVLGDAAAWRLARQVVLDHGGTELQALEKRLAEIAELVVQLSNAISDNVADIDEVDAYGRAFVEFVRGIPEGGATRKDQREAPADAAAKVDGLRVLLPLVRHYQAAKQRQGRIEFTDQIADGLRICREVPHAAEAIRERHRVVLLDEYQDTSVIQTSLLAELFRDRGVMAVGDPNQSIYGWRGASASNLAAFREDFSSTPELVPVHPLSKSWRNPPLVLDAANELAEPLRAASPIEVERLVARDHPVIGRFDSVYPETIVEEVEQVVDWLGHRLSVPVDDGAEPPTAAIILHKREHMQRFGDELARRGIPYRIVGGGGLLSTPEVTDLVAQLRVLVDPGAGSELIRLLAGARWRIGVKDLKALRDLARWLGDRDARQQPLADGVKDARKRSGIPADATSNAEALDFLVDAPAGHSRLAAFTEAGLARLRAFGAELRRLRGRVGMPLPDLVAHVEEAMRLDVEVVANEVSPVGLANLRAFRREAEGFAAVDDRGTLGAFLDWIDRAMRNDRELGAADPPSEPGTVQLITVHGAKGLEWDVVAIPRMVQDEFPAKAKADSSWVRLGALPYEFRRDRAALPELGWRAADQKEFKERLDAFHDALKERFAEEERRLIYVAVTRARRDLLLSGSWWATQTRPRQPGEYLARLAELGIVDPLPEAPEHDANPIDAGAADLVWPLDPLGERRQRVERAAALVAAADGVLPADASWARDLDLLLAEHAARGTAAPIEPPSRIPASGFKEWVGDPDAAAQRVLRPMPEQPYRATRLGTIFHAWVEDRYRTRAAESLFDLDDASADDADEFSGLAPADEAKLAELRTNFEHSRWAFLEPVAIERAIELPFAGRTVPCKIDAVFATVDGRTEIVDWKTGKAPRTAEEREAFDYQLALYRLAWSKATGTPVEDIDAKAFFVAAGEEYAPAALPGEAELLARWGRAIESLRPAEA
ncbi:MAG: ATP-dependent helicase [Microbacteriaceae bacterium]|nr:ATP-dependent helicase [Microbacteriaceae bacterium]